MRPLAVGILVLLVVAPAVVRADASESFDEDLLSSGKKLYSQYDEELIIRHFFRDRKNGFFVDVGSYEWKELSTTYYLEAHLGWSGIAVDANAELARGYHENRPRTTFLNYLVSDETGEPGTFYINVGGEGVSSTDASWIRKFYSSFFPGAEPEIRQVTVPTTSLTDLLVAQEVDEIDFLSMDIEGHEMKALAGFDIERFRPELVCIEWRGSGEALLDYFASHGYERIDEYLEHDQVNWYFTPRAAEEMP